MNRKPSYRKKWEINNLKIIIVGVEIKFMERISKGYNWPNWIEYIRRKH